MTWEDRLAQMLGRPVQFIESPIPDTAGQAHMSLQFAGGAILDFGYWRALDQTGAVFSSFDHEQLYGMPEKFDAKASFMAFVGNKNCEAIEISSETADIVVQFESNHRIEIFAFTSYEMWTFRFPDGAADYSNHHRC